MREIDKTAITEVDPNRLPSCLAENCGHCRSRVFLRPLGWSPSSGLMRYTVAQCPQCKEYVYLAVTGYGKTAAVLGGGQLFGHPLLSAWKPSEALADTLGGASQEMRRDYEGGVACINRDDYAGAVLAARRLLEGLVHQFLPVEEITRVLGTNLVKLTKARDLSPVLSDLASAVRAAGNMGAHFGASRVDRYLSIQSLLMVEELLKMHFLLEHRVNDLKEHFSRLDAQPIKDEP